MPTTRIRLHQQVAYDTKIAMSSISLSAPYTVFPLSQPLQHPCAKDREGSSHRRCYTSLVDSKRRKRTGTAEIAVAIDGEGVNIYDVFLSFPLSIL